MSFRLSKIIPWGRSLREYQLMFSLTEENERGRILGCGDGPASFNAEMRQRGLFVVSCDPLYALGAQMIQSEFEASVHSVMSQVRANPRNYVGGFHRDPDDLLRTRRMVMRRFISDYSEGRNEGRYVVGELPRLPFLDGAFDLALCSHLLFLYSEALSFEFHIHSLVELCRVAKEVRIFPLTDLTCEPSCHLSPVCGRLSELGFRFEIQRVNYQLQRNGDQMMRIWR